MKKALITGVTGQDGAYLAEFLLGRGYDVHGTSRNPSYEGLARLRSLGISEKVKLHTTDLSGIEDVSRLLRQVHPSEIYHLAGQSSVALSFQQPAATLSSAFMGTINLLETIRRYAPDIRLYHSASGEMFGGDCDHLRSEGDQLHPKSPYAVGKAASHWALINYRESYGLYACSAILFNHESPLRGTNFVTRKITASVARIRAGYARELHLGDLSIRRDWGYAPEYVQAMWLMLQQENPEEYVIATGKTHTLQDFVEIAFAEAGLDWKQYTVSDPTLFRPNEVRCTVGNPKRAKDKLDWETRTTFNDLVRLMVRRDLAIDGEDRFNDLPSKRAANLLEQ
jgi:GDPmannose 4,6-dehydratase